MGGSMRLRNKKTGEITRDDDWDFVGLVLKVNHDDDTIEMDDRIEYHSLAELNEDWEDYKSPEPLIKDEKIRKAVRAWAEANNVTKVWHGGSSVAFCDGAVYIIFNELCWEEIPEGEYTITELCGEEEE